MVYALANADARVGVAQLKADPQLSQPVVIRAAVGDCIKIQLRNDLSGYRVGIHPDGLVQFDPLDSDGARVGNNPDTTLATGEQRTFTWYADHEVHCDTAETNASRILQPMPVSTTDLAADLRRAQGRAMSG